jgi:hypothetical protein
MLARRLTPCQAAAPSTFACARRTGWQCEPGASSPWHEPLFARRAQ